MEDIHNTISNKKYNKNQEKAKGLALPFLHHVKKSAVCNQEKDSYQNATLLKP